MLLTDTNSFLVMLLAVVFISYFTLSISSCDKHYNSSGCFINTYLINPLVIFNCINIKKVTPKSIKYLFDLIGGKNLKLLWDFAVFI